MWKDNVAPTLSLPGMAKTLGMSYRATKEMVENNWSRKQVEAEKAEIRAAARRYRQGARKVNEALGDAVPEYSMSRLRWLELYRASLIEKQCSGGELLNDPDFIKFLLRKKEWLRVEIAKAQNKVGWTTPTGDLNPQALAGVDTPSLVIASHHGRKERGSTLLTTATR